MVTEQEQPLDEFILQIFEEQEEQFYYPVTSQNTARNFVKALHAKGVTYENVCQEIEEFEHNFSAWRKGLGRAGIGNRMIDRINRPLYEVLLSDDEEELNEILNRIKTRPANDRVPPINTAAVVHTEETRILRLQENTLRNQSKTSNGTKNDQTQHKLDQEKRRTNADNADDDSDDSDNEKPRYSYGDSPKVARSKKLPGAELEQKEPGLVDFRSVLKRRSNNLDNKTPGAGDRRSMPPSLGSLEVSRDSGIGQTAFSSSVDRINRTESLPLRAQSEPKQLSATDKKTSLAEGLALKLTEVKQNKPEQKDLFDIKNDVENEFDAEKEFDSLANSFEQETTAESTEASVKKASQNTKVAPLAADDDELSTSSGSEESSSDSGVTDQSSTKDDDEPAAEAEEEEDEEEEDEEEEEGEEEEEEEREYRPNYDSDLDDSNTDLMREGRQLAQQVNRYKDKVSNRDGPGYLYIFKDGSSKAKTKVGESRMPKKRLEQALCYNVDLEMVSALPVSLRKLAVQRAQARLKRYEIKGHTGWFQGPLDDIIQTVTSTAERYPKNSSEC